MKTPPNEKKRQELGARVVVSVSDLMQEIVAAEVEAQTDQWPAFKAGVLRRLEVQDRSSRRVSIEDRAIQQFQENIEDELENMGPSFEESFRKTLEARLWKEAQQSPNSVGAVERGWKRLVGLASKVRTAWVEPHVFALKLAAVSVAGVLTVLVWSQIGTSEASVGLDTLDGSQHAEVYLEEVDFGGDLLVVPEDGLTVVYLSQNAS